MKLIFVHGWSVTHTDTYGELAQALASVSNSYGIALQVQHINLAKYISFHDEVTLNDISKAMDRALKELPGNSNKIQEFSCITHSTGAPVVRNWIELFYGSKNLEDLPLKHLIMLAPANHGSALAVIGKKRLSRIKSWLQGVEPGQKVLDWLSLGSKGQWQLNKSYLSYDYAKHNFFPFVLTGQGIDTKFYDFLNDYLVEPGSDGVVRVAGANMNYRFLSLHQTEDVIRTSPKTLALLPDVNSVMRMPKKTPLGVFKKYSHSGKKMGIMRSPTKAGAQNEPVVIEIMKCLTVNNANDYQNRAKALETLTAQEQAGGSCYAMLILNIHDETGEPFEKDNFDVFLLAGKEYSPGKLPKGFFKDSQLNAVTNNLVYYINADKMSQIKDGLFGLRINARPTKGFSYYCAGEYRSEGTPIGKIIAPNQTTYIDITLKRQIDKNVYRFTSAKNKHENFKKVKPSGDVI